MNNSDILKNSYLKAKNNGYNCRWGDLKYALDCPTLCVFDTTDSFYGRSDFNKGFKTDSKWFGIRDFVFAHDFAKAFWGNELREIGGGYWKVILQEWEYHLQQMVLEKEPLKYLEKFLE